MSKNVVISLYDFTGEAVKPWAENGYECICFDIQHDEIPKTVNYSGGGSITYHKADLHCPATHAEIVLKYRGLAAFMLAFPVCTDLAVSGAAHFGRKRKENPNFQKEAVSHAVQCGLTGEALDCPFMVENPVSVLATHWRKPDHYFQPYEFGGYIPAEQAQHPTWPDYIAAFDAYPKKTCLWVGGGFVMPDPKPVAIDRGKYSIQHLKLGGKSQKTKNIRSATPRGFARAVFMANAKIPVDIP